jgi:hypothetical protein
MFSKGDVYTMIASGFVNVMVAVIIGIGVVVPVSTSVITAANLQGTDATLAGFITTLVIVALIVGITQLM